MDARQAARILGESGPEARRALAADADAPPEALYFLIGDADPAVRAAVAGNPASPPQGFEVLAADEETAVRGALARRLADLAPGLPGPQTDRLAHMAWAALARLAEDAVEEIAGIVVLAVKALPAAPRAMVLALARQRRASLAAPVIRLSPLLTEQDLLDLVAAPPVAATLSAVARRPAISETVADALAASGDTAAIAALLGNGSAAIREGTLDALVVQAAERTAWQEPLVRRPCLPPRAALALAGFVAEHLLDPLLRRADLPAAAAAQLRATVAQRLAGAARPGETAEDAAARARMLGRAGALDETAVLNAARRGEKGFVIAALAGLCGLPRPAVEQAAAARCVKSIGGMSRQAGFGETTAEAVAELLAPRMPGAAAAEPACVGDGELRWRIDATTRAAAR